MKEQRRPHILLELLMTTSCVWEELILLRRFVSEFIHISYFSYANHTREVALPFEDLHSVLCRRSNYSKILFLHLW